MDHLQNYLELKATIERIEKLERRVKLLEDSSPSIPQAGVDLAAEDLRDEQDIDLVGVAESVLGVKGA